MIASVNCLILGEASKTNFNVVVDEVYTNDDKIDVAFDKFTVSNFKELLFRRKKVKRAVQDHDSMDLYKVKLRLPNLKDKIYTKDEIEDLGAMMESMVEFKEYFNNDDKKPKSKCLHIFIVPTIVAPATVGPSQQGISQVTTPKPKDIFKEFLNSKHGQFLKTYIKNNDPLPSYESRIQLKPTVPASSTGERPSLLKYNLPGGTSGCGKTRTCYELLCENWGLYFVASRKGNGGSADIEKIQTYLETKMTEDFEQTRKRALGIVRCAILSRLLILNYCLKSASAFNKQRWLLIQTCQDIFGKLYDYNDDMFVALMLKLNTCTPLSVMTYIDNIYQEISVNKTFVIILDETQVLETVLKGKFKSRTGKQKRSLLSPIIQALRQPAPSMVNYCVIPCGSGLGILSLEDVRISGISKPETEIPKFTEFGGWQDIAHVKNYVNNLVSLTDNEYNCLYNHFRGRFRPIVTCVEDIIMGLPAEDVIDVHWKVLTKASDNDQSLYHQLCRIIKMERPNHVLSTNILNLYKSVTLAYYYSGGPFLFTDTSQMSLVESGFGRLQFVNPPTISHLRQACKGIDEDKLRISSVNVDLLHPALEGKKSLVAYVDEPFALTAGFNFFKDHDSLPKDILNMMSKVNNASSWGTLWQMYLPDEFEQIFNGRSDIRNMPVFAEVAKKYNLPAFCIGSPKIAKSSDVTVPRVANASAGYTLDKFFNESPETRPTFYFPEDRCGPDIIFFVEFEQVTVPVFVQVKLRYVVKEMAGALSTIHPDMFYKNKNGDVYNEESNKPIIDKIIEICKVGSIGLLVAYPADVFQESYVTNNHLHDLRNRSSNQQLIGIIDHKNASTVFRGDHLQFLDELKGTAKERN
ncbi:unnamed protein product [Rhizophagus irregularis]|nr:unnamed protein product [Rhizophagus irregularis]